MTPEIINVQKRKGLPKRKYGSYPNHDFSGCFFALIVLAECIIGDSMTYLVPQLEHIYYLPFKGQDKDLKDYKGLLIKWIGRILCIHIFLLVVRGSWNDKMLQKFLALIREDISAPSNKTSAFQMGP